MMSPLFRITTELLSGSVSDPLPTCPICNSLVPLETAKTDEYGVAIHEECYVLKVKSSEQALPAPAP
jgi:hypothetical protein